MSQPFDNRDWDVRQISEKEAEIERFNGEIRKLETLWFSENYRMRDLLKRAADALEDLRGPGWKRELIAELRKAAQ